MAFSKESGLSILTLVQISALRSEVEMAHTISVKTLALDSKNGNLSLYSLIDISFWNRARAQHHKAHPSCGFPSELMHLLTSTKVRCRYFSNPSLNPMYGLPHPNAVGIHLNFILVLHVVHLGCQLDLA